MSAAFYLNNSVNINVTATASPPPTRWRTPAGPGGGFGGGGNTFIYSGGGYIGGGTAPAATALTGLRLAGAASAAAATYEMVEEERTRWVEGWRVVRVVCVDDTGTPHPASRPDPNERVDAHFDGEIFRCMAGTALQATIGWREDGHDRYDGGDTIHCRKGEALRHAPAGI
jgi:ribosome modulation factor